MPYAPEEARPLLKLFARVKASNVITMKMKKVTDEKRNIVERLPVTREDEQSRPQINRDCTDQKKNSESV